MSSPERFKSRRLLYGTGTAVSVVLVLGILTVVALLSSRYQLRWDLTRAQSQSLTPFSQSLLKELKGPLTMTVFLPEGSGERPGAKEVLQLYIAHHPQVSYRFVDPEKEPLQAQEAGYRFAGNVVLSYQGRRQLADRTDEESITNALHRVMKVARKKLYFLTGHGERGLDDPKPGGFSVAKKALENEGYDVTLLNLLSQGAVPQDAAVVIVAAPKKPLLVTEIQTLKAFVDKGGRLLVLLEAFQDGGLKDFLAGYGVNLDDGIILDVNQVSQALGVSAVMPLVSQYGPSKITQDFKNIVTLYPMSRPLWLKADQPGVVPGALATTMSTSYEKFGKEWIQTNQAGFNPQQDKKGPFTLAAQIEVKPSAPSGEKPQETASKAAGPEKESPEKENPGKNYLVVFGDTDFAANSFFNLFGNGDLFLNTTNFLANEMEQITVRPATKAQLLTLNRQQIWTLFLTSLVWAPLVMLLAGIWAYRRRRARR